MVAMSHSISQLRETKWPRQLATLESLRACCPKSHAICEFEDRVVFSRLQHLEISGLGKSTQLTSEWFPALQSFGFSSGSKHIVLDLSAMKQPLDLDIVRFFGTIIPPPPSFPFKRLKFDVSDCLKSSSPPSFFKMLSRVCSLNLILDGNSRTNQADLSLLSAKMHGVAVSADQPFASSHLQQLQIRGSNSTIKFGAFPALRCLALLDVNTEIDGRRFPSLETLMIVQDFRDRNKRIDSLSGRFQALRSLTLECVTLNADFSFDAPCLQELSFICVPGAHNVIVGRSKFPELQMVTVKNTDYSGKIILVPETYIPRFRADPISSLRTRPLVFLRLDTHLTVDDRTRLANDVPGWIISVVALKITRFLSQEWRF